MRDRRDGREKRNWRKELLANSKSKELMANPYWQIGVFDRRATIRYPVCNRYTWR
jgi:hypothetical protein